MTFCAFWIGPHFIGGYAGRADQSGIDRPLPEQLPPPAERMPGHKPGRLCDQQVAVERIAAKAQMPSQGSGRVLVVALRRRP